MRALIVNNFFLTLTKGGRGKPVTEYPYFKPLNTMEAQKKYTITLDKLPNGKDKIKRFNEGFSTIELLGLFDLISAGLKDAIIDEIKSGNLEQKEN
jgi:hypothetical protein